MGERLFVPCKAFFEGAFCEANVLFVLILGPYDSGLVDHTFVHEASAVERAGAFGAITCFNIVVGVGITVYDFVVVSLYNGLHVFSAAVPDFKCVAVEDFGKGIVLVKVSVYQIEELPTKVSFECFVVWGIVPYYMSGSSSLGALTAISLTLIDKFIFVPTMVKRSVVLTC